MRFLRFEFTWLYRDNKPVANWEEWRRKISKKKQDRISLIGITITTKFHSEPDDHRSGSAVLRTIEVCAVMSDGDNVRYEYLFGRTALSNFNAENAVDGAQQNGYLRKNFGIDAQQLKDEFRVPVIVMLPQILGKEDSV